MVVRVGFQDPLGCCKYGNECVINPSGRGGQPNTLFEWTSALFGVWDSSMVDGFQLPMKIEMDQVQPGHDSVIYIQADPTLCPKQSNG